MASFIGKFYHPLFYSAIPHTVVCGSALLEQRVWKSKQKRIEEEKLNKSKKKESKRKNWMNERKKNRIGKMDWMKVRNEYKKANRSTQLEVVVALNALLSDRVRKPLRLASFEVSREQIAKPTLEQRRHSSQEEHPDTPHGRPKSCSWTLSYRSL